jgi:hypothetical protein
MRPASSCGSGIVRTSSIISLVACVSCGAAGWAGPCGGGQFAEAGATLPDTGLNHGAEIKVGFDQHDTDELTEYSVNQLWEAGTSPAVDADSRLRVVRTDGLVLVDTSGLAYRPGQPPGRPGFLAWGWIKEAARRNAWYDGFADDNLWIELWHPGASAASTRVRLHTTRREVTPVETCL